MPFPPTTLTERLLHAVKRLEVETPAGTRIATAYGYQVQVAQNRQLPALITTRAALAQAQAITFHMHLAQGGEPLRETTALRMAGATLHIVPHPTATVDLAALLPARAITAWGQAHPGRSLYAMWLDDTVFFPEERWDELDALESLAIIAATEKLTDSANHLPLILAAHSASHPLLDWSGQPEFLLGARLLPGMWGAPVLLMPGAGRAGRSPEALGARSRYGLIGTLRGGVGADPQGIGLVVKARETHRLLEGVRREVTERLKPN